MSPVRFDVRVSGAERQAETKKSAQQSGNGSFKAELKAQIESGSQVAISAHARKRFAERSVEFGSERQARLNEAVDRVGRTGADKSLVLMDDLALVVSARNRVVITALDATAAKDGVFTDIDSAVIV